MKRMIMVLGVACAACTPKPAPVVPPPSPAPSVATTPLPAPPGPSASAGTSSPLSCATPLPPFAFVAPTPGERTPSAGQMTEEAAQAKRLFDQERWDEAVNALVAVARGDTGDDEGNKQLAEYYRAVALHHGGHGDDSAAAFLAIAGRPAHIKHFETLLWLVKLAQTAPRVVRAMAYYDVSDAMRFGAPAQTDTQQGALFLLGRERFERGAKPEARELLLRVEASSRWHPLARECLDLIDAP